MRVSCLGQLHIVGERAEVRVDGVHVGGTVAVIVLRASGIAVDRGSPDGGYAELLKIVEVLRDAAEVAPVPAAGQAALTGPGIVGCVSIGEAVGHDEIHHVARGESVKAVG